MIFLHQFNLNVTNKHYSGHLVAFCSLWGDHIFPFCSDWNVNFYPLLKYFSVEFTFAFGGSWFYQLAPILCLLTHIWSNVDWAVQVWNKWYWWLPRASKDVKKKNCFFNHLEFLSVGMSVCMIGHCYFIVNIILIKTNASLYLYKTVIIEWKGEKKQVFFRNYVRWL